MIELYCEIAYNGYGGVERNSQSRSENYCFESGRKIFVC